MCWMWNCVGREITLGGNRRTFGCSQENIRGTYNLVRDCSFPRTKRNSLYTRKATKNTLNPFKIVPLTVERNPLLITEASHI